MKNNRDRSIAFLMLLPSLILLGIFVYFFIGRAIQSSMTDWGENPAQPPLSETVEISYVGLDNYVRLMTSFTESSFRVSLVNTFFFTIFFVAGCIMVGLFLAILLDQRVAGEGIFRTIFLFPMALSFVVTGTIWRWMLQPRGGVNILPTLIGLDPIDFAWVNSQETWFQFLWQDVPRILTFVGIGILLIMAVRYALNQRWRSMGFVAAAAIVGLLVFMAGAWDYIWPALDVPAAEPTIAPKGFNVALLGVIIAAVWQMSGYTMAMFIAGIRGVAEELREAARVDGASELGVYRYIILPQLNPIILSAMIILGHISLKIFDLVFAMAGPDNAKTIVPGILVYTKGFRANAFASASAVAVIMLFFVAIIIIPYLWTQLRSDDD
ncbi:MAG: glucose transporter [Anaerolineaceae bacterium]|nr:glucose transporter [Anaerolineaceae bacterium]